MDIKHHCRACGGGICERCSAHFLPIPWRGWGNSPVRVCDECYNHHFSHKEEEEEEGGGRERENGGSNHSEEERGGKEEEEEGEETQAEGDGSSTAPLPAPALAPTTVLGSERVTARCVGERVQSAVGVVVGAMQYPRGLVVESARPDYWVPDNEILNCHNCRKTFGVGGATGGKHHCRACGQGVCTACSQHRLCVPSRGWDYPVRVCNDCAAAGMV